MRNHGVVVATRVRASDAPAWKDGRAHGSRLACWAVRRRSPCAAGITSFHRGTRPPARCVRVSHRHIARGNPVMKRIVIFSGTAHIKLAAEISRCLRVRLSPSVITRFSNDCLSAQLQANCREADVYVIQPLSPPVQEHLMELLLMLDAGRGASAARLTAVIPHYAYARSDKKDAPRISIAARLVADLLATAGATRVLTMTLHSEQVHGFFSVPVDHLNALQVLAHHFGRQQLK